MRKRIDPFKKVKRRSTGRKTKAQKSREEALEVAIALMEKIEGIKGCYKELDLLTDKLLAEGFTEGFVNGKHLIMKDRFAVKNTVWKSTPHRRYELEFA